MKTRYGAHLENLRNNSTVGLLIDEDCCLHLYINGVDQGIAATDLPATVYAVVDLYGQCEQISIISSSTEPLYNDSNNTSLPEFTDEIENSREKADLECHEKEHSIPAVTSNLSLNIPIQSSHVDSNNANVDSPYPFYINNGLNLLSTKATSSDNNLASGCSSGVSNTQWENYYKDKHYEDKPLNDKNTNSNTQKVNIRNECTNVEINNATNINIKNGSVMSTSNMSNLNTAITSTNANNAINESIASNSQNSDPNNLHVPSRENSTSNMEVRIYK